MASVRDIARHAGVSITTVSRVLNNHPRVSDEAREKVLAAANRHRYVPNVGRRSTTNVAFVYTGEASLGSPFDAAVLQGMSDGMKDQGLDLLILNAETSRRPQESYSQMFFRKGVRGVVLRTTAQTREACREIAREGFPAVLVGDVMDEPGLVCVDADAYISSQRAIEHLLHLGHRRIAITLNVVDDYDHDRRRQAYVDALTSAGIEVDERLVLRVPAYCDAGAQGLRQIMTMPNRPTAVFATDPPAATGLFHEASRLGVRIPQDLSVIGFDDTNVRLGVYPRMSAVCQNAEELGREAFNALSRLIDNGGSKRVEPTPLNCWLELHDSTAAPAPAETSPIR